MGMKRRDGGDYQEPEYLGFRAAVQRELTKHVRQFNLLSGRGVPEVQRHPGCVLFCTGMFLGYL